MGKFTRSAVCLTALLFPLVGRAQFATFDAANYGLNGKNLFELQQLYAAAQQYRQVFESSQAFFKCPSCLLNAASDAAGAIENIMVDNGTWSPNSSAHSIENLRKILKVGTVAAQQAQTASAMSAGNGANVAMLAIQMGQAAQQLQGQLALLQQQARIDYYTHLNGYTPQAAAISSWRLK